MNGLPRILLVDFSNYEDYPIGGYLSFARNMIDAFGPRIALVGISTSSGEPVGRWFKKNIDGRVYDFFSVARYKRSETRHMIPDRLAIYILVKYYFKRIRQIDIKNVFVQRQEILLAINPGVWNICYSFAGLENPLSISKYWYGKLLARPFESCFFAKLRYASVILARGDDASIEKLLSRSSGYVMPDAYIRFPTRINTEIFKPENKEEARLATGLQLSIPIIVTSGRLAEFKGWKFMIDCFNGFCRELPNSKLYFIGEGEDYNQIKAYISQCNLDQRIILAGKKSQPELSLYLNAADMFIMGSYKEGWSTALMEAIACGVPACVTDFSSASDIVLDGENGFVVGGHDKVRFTECMLEALKFHRPVKNDHIMRYSTKFLQEEILKHWQLS